MKAGDFTGLASAYSQNRPDYSPTVLRSIFGLLKVAHTDCDFVDVGAGTGIWTRMVNNYGVRSVSAVEPNQDMRDSGIADSVDTNITWINGSAEVTGLADNSADLLSMASSFHWADFSTATKEFHRLLRPGGRFVALWNPRLIEVNPLLVEIEAHLDTLRPDIKRVSSGRSGITSTLYNDLTNSNYFTDVIYLEAQHVIPMSVSRYIGAWKSVNDLRVQLGDVKFDQFLDFVISKTKHLDVIEATYLTRAWTAEVVK